MVSMLAINSFAGDGGEPVKLDTTIFYDSNFCNYLKLNYDKNSNGYLDEAELKTITTLSFDKKNLNGLEFNDLTGISKLSYLETLELVDIPITSLDLSSNYALVNVKISLPTLNSLTLGNPALRKLEIREVSKSFGTLNLLECPELRYLNICDNERINTSIGSKPIINVINNPYLCALLKTNGVRYCNETRYPVVHNTSYIEYGNVNGEEYLSYGISGDEELDFEGINIRNFTGIEHFSGLKTVHFNGNDFLGKLNLSKNTNLERVYVRNSNITDINVTNLTNLKALYVNDNPNLKNIDVTTNPKLEELNISSTGISSINISKNPLLNYFMCIDNNVTTLALGDTPILLDLYNNGERTFSDTEKLIRYKNGADELIISDNIEYIYFDSAADFIDINEINFPDEAFREYVDKNFDTERDDDALSPAEIAKASVINLNESDVENLKGIEFLTSLQELECVKCSNITSVDLSSNKELTYINCGFSGLEELTLGDKPVLEYLYVEFTNLNGLYLGGCPNLKNFSMYNSTLKSVDLKKCPYLEEAINGDKVTLTIRELNIDADGKVDYYSSKNSVVILDADQTVVTNPAPTSTPTGGANSGTTPTTSVAPTTAPTGGTTPTTAPSGAPTSVPTSAPTAAPTAAPELDVGAFVNRCYKVALGRDADEAGYNYWVDNLNNGQACGAQVGYGFIFSQEYFNKNRTNEEFVTDLYSMYFDRTPDTDGFNYWMDKLNAGDSREAIFAGFANSLEFYNLCTKYGVTQGIYIEGVDNTQQGGINCFVARLYKVCFNRLPDMDGQGGWVLKLYNGEVSGTTCSYGFIFSPEFIGQNPSNEDFVNYMYAAFFGREADEAGFNAWVDILNGGGSYEDVFNGFTGSAEFANLCASYGIQA